MQKGKLTWKHFLFKEIKTCKDFCVSQDRRMNINTGISKEE